jgi:hypothetical protein
MNIVNDKRDIYQARVNKSSLLSLKLIINSSKLGASIYQAVYDNYLSYFLSQILTRSKLICYCLQVL